MITQSANYPLWNELERKSAIFAESIQFHFIRTIRLTNSNMTYGVERLIDIVFYIYIDQILYIFYFQFMWKLSRNSRGNTWSPTDNLDWRDEKKLASKPSPANQHYQISFAYGQQNKITTCGINMRIYSQTHTNNIIL